jgi:hypothetical protein
VRAVVVVSGVGPAGSDKVVAVCSGQGQEAVPDPPFDLGRRRRCGELEVAEFPSGLKTVVNEGAVCRHHLECADDLIAGAGLGSPVAGDGGQLEQVVGCEVFRAVLGAFNAVGRTVVAGEEVTA